MTDALRVASRRNPSFAGEGFPHSLWGDRSGALVHTSQLRQLVAAGFGYHVTVGALTTPIAGDGTVYDAERSALSVSVPSGTAIMPIRLSVQTEVPADTDGEVNEIFAHVDRVAVSTASASTGTVEVAFNMRTDNPRTSNCTVVSANTSDHGTPTNSFELAHSQMIVDVVTSGITQGVLDLLYEPDYPPIIVGPGAIYVYWCGTAAQSAFGQFQWVELPESLNALWGGS